MTVPVVYTRAHISYTCAVACGTFSYSVFTCSLGGGTTWQSSGVMGLLRTSPAELAIVVESLKLYQHLQSIGYDIGR